MIVTCVSDLFKLIACLIIIIASFPYYRNNIHAWNYPEEIQSIAAGLDFVYSCINSREKKRRKPVPFLPGQVFVNSNADRHVAAGLARQWGV